jgi:hypothetical protein
MNFAGKDNNYCASINLKICQFENLKIPDTCEQKVLIYTFINTSMESLPIFISVIFALTTLSTVAGFYWASGKSKIVMIVFTAWTILQTFIGLSEFYEVTRGLPPRILFLVLPPFATILFLFVTMRGRKFIDGLSVERLTLLHTVRFPVEVVLFWLSMFEMVPQLMTFEGRNFDILAGMTAPLVWYFGYRNKKMGRRAILWWNLICMALLLNIVVNAVLSVPFDFQQFAFDQPNIAVLYFPFLFLPGLVVPIVILAHLVSIKHLMRSN